MSGELSVEHVIALIREYQSRVEEAVSLFQEHRNLNPLDWHQHRLEQIGFIDAAETIKYFFHGIGCWVQLPSGSIDWDFGPEARHDGFDVWQLWRFAVNGTNNFPEFTDKGTLEAAFAEAEAKNIIKQLYREQHCSLYFFTDIEDKVI